MNTENNFPYRVSVLDKNGEITWKYIETLESAIKFWQEQKKIYFNSDCHEYYVNRWISFNETMKYC